MLVFGPSGIHTSPCRAAIGQDAGPGGTSSAISKDTGKLAAARTQHSLDGLSLAPGSCALVDTSLMFCSNHLAVEDTLSHTLMQLDREHVLPINFQLFSRQMKFDVAGAGGWWLVVS